MKRLSFGILPLNFKNSRLAETPAKIEHHSLQSTLVVPMD
jgi:hypothetical protein